MVATKYTAIQIKIFCFFFSRPRVILGVTNPFFTKTLHHWPHLVAVGLNEGHSRRSSVTPPIGQSFKQSFAQRPGFYSKYKPYLKKDNKLIKAFLEVNYMT